MALITRANTAALIDLQQTQQIWQEAASSSMALKTFAKLDMGTSQARLKLLDVLPTAAFVDSQGDGGPSNVGIKPTTSMAWRNKTIQAEEVAMIIPIPENVVDDASTDVWAQIRPRIAAAIGSVLDAAVFFGVGLNGGAYPTSWPTGGLKGNATAAGNVVSRAASEGRLIGTGTAVVSTDTITTSAAHGLSVGNAVVLGGGGTVTGFTAGTKYYVLTVPSSTTLTLSATPGGSTLNLTGADGSVGSVAQVGVNGMPSVPGQDLGYTVSLAEAAVEDDGFMPNTIWSSRRLRQDLRVLRDANGNLLFLAASAYSGTLDGLDVNIATNASWEPSVAGSTYAIVGDSSKAILGLRQDMTMKLLDQSVITDASGNILFNLAQQDMVALRVKARFGFQIADSATELAQNGSPFACINA